MEMSDGQFLWTAFITNLFGAHGRHGFDGGVHYLKSEKKGRKGGNKKEAIAFAPKENWYLSSKR